MSEKNINEKIRTAVSHSVPDVFDSILSNLEEQKGQVIPMNSQPEKQPKRKNWIKRSGIIAAAVLALFVAGIAGFNVYDQKTVDSVISLDVNPSLEMKVNKNEKVLEVKPLNEDGQIIVGEMDFKNTDLEMAVNALIGSMLKNGYISEIKNSILISVENKDEARRASLQKKLTEEIDKLLRASSINGAIVSQAVTNDEQLKTLADEHAITSGKAQLVKQLVEAEPKYQFEELARLSINELNLLVESRHVELENASAVGNVSDKAYIGKEMAVRVAFQHAGVNESAVRNLEVEMDYDDGKMVYEVEFYALGMEYEYEIDAVSGVILTSEIEKDDDDDDRYDDDRYDDDRYDDDDKYDDDDRDNDRYDSGKNRGHNDRNGRNNDRDHEGDDRNDDRSTTNPAKPATSENNGSPGTKPEQPVVNPTQPEQSSSSRLSAADARKQVLDKFGGIIQKIEYNYDDRNPLYKGEALKSGHKVVFELNARTNSFKKWDVGNDNEWDEFSHALSNMITMDEAANLVIKKSGKSDTFVQKIEFKWDDSEPKYEGEAFNRGVKYSFEIYAYDGSFDEWDVDSDDDTWEEKYYNVR